MQRIISALVFLSLVATFAQAIPMRPSPSGQTLSIDLLLSIDPSLARQEKLRKVIKLMEAGRRDEANLEIAQMLKNNPKDKGALELAGISLMQMGNFTAAEESFRRMVNLPPVSLGVVSKYGVTKIFNGDVEEGSKLLRQVLNYEPQNRLANRYLGWVAERSGDLPLAASYLDKLPGVAEVGLREHHVALARIYSTIGQHDKVIGLLQAAFPENKIGSGVDQYGAALHLTIAYAANGQKSEADSLEAVLKPKIAANPLMLFGLTMGRAQIEGDEKSGLAALDQLRKSAPKAEAEARFEMAKLYLNRKDIPAALEQFDSALELANETEVQSMIRFVTPILLEQNMTSLALDTMESLTRKYPANDQFAYGLAELQDMLDMRAKSLQTIDRLVERPEPYAPAYLLGAKLARIDGNLPLAQRYLEDLLKLEPDNADGWIGLAGIDYDRGNSSGAIKKLGEGISRNGSNARLKFELGSLYQNAGQLQRANEQYKAALLLNGNYVAAMDNLAANLLDMNTELEQAHKYASTLYGMAPEDPYIQDLMGWALYRTGDLQGAEKQLANAASRMTDSGRADYHLALALRDMGNTEKAAKHFNSALEKGLPASSRAAAETELAALK